MTEKMKIVCISDTHGLSSDELLIPDAKILIHSGDSTARSSLYEVFDFIDSYSKLLDGTVEHIVFTPGNHGRVYESPEYLVQIREYLKEIPNFHLLINESATIEGLNIWGSPVTPPFNNWAFNEESPARHKLWQTIPEDTDIVVTHGPAKYIRDIVNVGFIDHVGCPHLGARITEISPLLHVFGHIHSSNGIELVGDTVRINASVLNELYTLEYPPILVEVERPDTRD